MITLREHTRFVIIFVCFFFLKNLLRESFPYFVQETAGFGWGRNETQTRRILGLVSSASLSLDGCIMRDVTDESIGTTPLVATQHHKTWAQTQRTKEGTRSKRYVS